MIVAMIKVDQSLACQTCTVTKNDRTNVDRYKSQNKQSLSGKMYKTVVSIF